MEENLNCVLVHRLCAYSRSKQRLAVTMVLLCSGTRNNRDRKPQFILFFFLSWKGPQIELHVVYTAARVYWL